MNVNVLTALIGTAGLVLGSLIPGLFQAYRGKATDTVATWAELRKDYEAVCETLEKCRTKIEKLEEGQLKLREEMQEEREARARAEMACRVCIPLYEAALQGVLPDKIYVDSAGRELRRAGFLALVISDTTH